MNLYCINLLMFTKIRNIKTKCEVDAKISLYYRSIDCDFKEELTDF